MEHASSFANRLRKNFRHRRRWAQRQGLTAYRIYDRDIPGFPFSVDWYDGRIHLLHYPPRHALRNQSAEHQLELGKSEVSAVLQVSSRKIFGKTHLPKVWGEDQYQRLARSQEAFTVQENGLRFWVNLGDYLDSGLFLDHRLTRTMVRSEASEKRFLNLFSYTGSFTVAAVAGGAVRSTSVDLSSRYLDWAKRNLRVNDLHKCGAHEWIRADALSWVESARSKDLEFDLIVLDPPSFSTSKRMAARFEVQRDHPKLLAAVLHLLAPKGVLYFSTPFQGFHLQYKPEPGLSLLELTPDSIPEDFSRKEIHRCWRFERPADLTVQKQLVREGKST